MGAVVCDFVVTGGGIVGSLPPGPCCDIAQAPGSLPWRMGLAGPGTFPDEASVLVRGDLWAAFRDLSLWIEALCVGPRQPGQRRGA